MALELRLYNILTVNALIALKDLKELTDQAETRKSEAGANVPQVKFNGANL